ncbi:MarR family winged helix-turn-helix transcriptional regulator [Pseudogemmobacter blasticus]|uniref:MarR family winged helix-turn-helix transcriptional regulator n=1 Tax=Fuscovulum blasticum TaxID=1075 RepID=UPI0015E76FDB|nr:MarR family transcriptional regulator [Fuscovulum blasticum]
MTAPSPLTAHLGYWLRLVSNHVSARFAERLDRLGITVAEWVALRLLFDADSLPPSQLAARMGLTRGAVTKLADRLRARGLLARSADADDGRGVRLALTEAGRALVPALAEAADRNEAEAFAALSAEDRALLHGLLTRIATRQGLTAPPLA